MAQLLQGDSVFFFIYIFIFLCLAASTNSYGVDTTENEEQVLIEELMARKVGSRYKVFFCFFYPVP